jgi:cysteinyl-tRNA synthetase
LFDEAMAALRDDLNVPMALGALFAGLKKSPPESLAPAVAAADLAAFDQIVARALGFNLDQLAKAVTPVPPAIQALAEKRWAAKQAKDFAAADALRKELAAAGWSMADRKDGYSIEPLKK